MSATHYRFGDFKLLPAERLLFRRGSEVALTARAFELLVAFAERAGQLLAKDELMKRVWAGVVVEENNLAVQVGVLRKLLGSEAITTIPGFGYRFALPVLDMAEAAPAESAQGRLPLRLPTLVGRQDALQDLQALLREHPVVTLCGGPGFGKTRLAQQLALQLRGDYADGTWWVDLTVLRDDESVASAVARVLGLPPGENPLHTLAAKLSALTLLVVLDNAEHRVADVAGFVAALVQHTERVSVLVTSQLPLQVAGERIYRVAPLPLPDAIRLLAERSGEAEAGAQAEAICAALDCNPLAIELAASRVDALGLDGLAARLHERLTLLAPTGASPSRRNALAEALSWSHELLAERERRVLRRLAVFPGSFSLEGAALVLADDDLPAAAAVTAVLSLVERSLVSIDRGHARRRFRLLETMRLFALDKLAAAGETALAEARHCAGLVWLLDDAYEESWRLPYAGWKARYLPELPGLWAALDWAGQHDLPAATALFGAAAPLWLPRATQARPHALALAARLADKGDAIPPAVLARFWWACARCHSVVHPGHAREAAEHAARLYRELGDERGEYLALVELAFNWRVDRPEARAALAAARRLENPGWPAAVLERGLTTEAVLHQTSGRHAQARRCYEAALDICERGGFDAGVIRARLNLADQARAAGELDRAIELGEALLADPGDAGDLTCLATILGNLIGALVAQGRFDRAREVALECPRRLGRLGLGEQLWVSLDALALLHLHAGRTALAAQLAGAADREFEDHGQMQRQPNEAADRATLAAGLARQLEAAEVSRLEQEGRRMSSTDAMRAAFELGGV